jgi:hypothetical protein
LFLSGFAIQRRTLNDLRKAIRQPPRPSPKSYLPDRFKAATTELEDGTIIILESEAEREAREQSEAVTIQIDATSPGQSPNEERVEEEESERQAREPDKPIEGMTERELNVWQQSQKDQPNPDPESVNQKPLSRSERRRLIKEEIHRLSHDSEPVLYQRRLW